MYVRRRRKSPLLRIGWKLVRRGASVLARRGGGFRANSGEATCPPTVVLCGMILALQ